MRLPILVMSFLLIFGCCGAGAEQASAGSAPASHSKITFVVGSSANYQLLRNVRVVLFGSEKGPQDLGATDERGRVVLDKAVLREEPRGAVLLCLEGFFCGAFRISDLDVDAYDEKLIHLAPVAMQ